MDSKVTWEADPRHVMDHEGVAPQGSCKDAQRQLTTGEENGPSDDDVESADEAKQHKCVGAPANYLGLDRPDFQFTSRALCKRVSKPMKGDFEHVKRLGRLLRSHPRAMCSYPWQHDVSEVIVRTDSDWVGDKRDGSSVS